MGTEMKHRWEFIQYCIDLKKYKSYLEIGTCKDETLSKINCEFKVGVDPAPEKHHPANSDLFFDFTSDYYFETIKLEFDIIFIDGLHHREQVLKDVKNSLKVLRKGGTIILDDCLPKWKEQQEVPRIARYWTGDVWKAVVELRCTRDDLEILVIPIDKGMGVIREGINELLYTKEDLTYENFVKNKDNWLNIKTIEAI
jgi:SAM-dependent methyltransferase